jgi:predicted dehydrogenase
MEPVRIGVVGCGNISGIYLANSKKFPITEIKACADIQPERAKTQAEKYGIEVFTVDEILNDQEIEIILNLTPPGSHASVAIAALNAGKSVYNEKPLSIFRKDAEKMLRIATEKNLKIGCAPDTFLGAGLQTCRNVIDSGLIGRPIAATAFMLGRGPEGWHPDPEFFYKVGGGPMFDMGPYYLTALIHLIGAVKRVTGSAQISFPERTIGSEVKRGQKIVVETPTHLVGVLDFVQGAVGTIITSFDVWAHSLPRIEIYGTEGSLRVPDPNTFGGKVEIWKPEKREWEEIPYTHGYAENFRGLGLADMATSIRTGRTHRANGNLAYHVLDIMHAIIDGSQNGKHIELNSIVERPSPMVTGLLEGNLEE